MAVIMSPLRQMEESSNGLYKFRKEADCVVRAYRRRIWTFWIFSGEKYEAVAYSKTRSSDTYLKKWYTKDSKVAEEMSWLFDVQVILEEGW